MKVIDLLPVANNIPHHPKKKETTRTSVLVTTMEDFVVPTLEELEESSEETV